MLTTCHGTLARFFTSATRLLTLTSSLLVSVFLACPSFACLRCLRQASRVGLPRTRDYKAIINSSNPRDICRLFAAVPRACRTNNANVDRSCSDHESAYPGGWVADYTPNVYCVSFNYSPGAVFDGSHNRGLKRTATDV